MNTQAPDTAPGPYYVSAVDGKRSAYISGPYATHPEALAQVDVARRIASKHDPRSHFAAFGTMRCKPETTAPGVLQRVLGYSLPLVAE